MWQVSSVDSPGSPYAAETTITEITLPSSLTTLLLTHHTAHDVLLRVRHSLKKQVGDY